MSEQEHQFVQGPYKGLVPYDPEDAPLFFGRETDRQVVVSSLWSRRLTLLYGPSGVGKTSLLQAGVLYHLWNLAQENLKIHGSPEIAVIRFSEWREDPLPALLESLGIAVRKAWPNRDFEPAPSGLSLLETLRLWTRELGGTMFVLLDQFEDYFLYHPVGEEDGAQFEREFADAVSTTDLPVGFLLSLREDALSHLDRFKGRITDLFGGYLRLGHLDREMAREAIERPLVVWSLNRGSFRRFLEGQIALVQGVPPAQKIFSGEGEEKDLVFSAEPNFVEAVLDQVALGRVSVGTVVDPVKCLAEVQRDRIETPYLQLVLIRVWQEEERRGSLVLRYETLNRLGGAAHIVQAHLDQVLGSFALSEQEVAAKVLRFLVTPQGSKIALSGSDIGEYAGLSEKKVTSILRKLQAPEDRIVRPVRDLSGEERYEIFHDVLGTAILDWQRRFRERQYRKKRFWASRLGAVLVALLALVTLVSFKWISGQQRKIDVNRLALEAFIQPEDKIDRALLLAIQAQHWADSSEIDYVLPTIMKRQPYLEKIVDRPTGVRRALVVGRGQDVLIAVGKDNKILAWPEPEGERHLVEALRRVLALYEVVEAKEGGGGREEDGTGQVNVLAISSTSDGVLIAAEDFFGAQCVVQRIRIWKVVEVHASIVGEIRRDCDKAVASLAFASTGKQMVTGGRDGTLQKWSLAGRGLAEIGGPIRGHRGEVRSLALDVEKDRLASGGRDGKIVLWSLRYGSATGRWLGERSMVSSIAFSLNGARLAVGRSNGTVQLWSVAEQEPVTEPIHGHNGEILGVAFRPQGRLLTIGQDGTVRMWSTSRQSVKHKTPIDLRDHACQIANRNLSIDEWKKFVGEAPYELACERFATGKRGFE